MDVESSARKVQFRSGQTTLAGMLAVPNGATATVIFAPDGEGSSRHRHVASVLNEAGFATLEFNPRGKRQQKDLDRLTLHLLSATAWVMQEDETRLHRIGYFATGAGAAAALASAAELPRSVGALVSYDGKLDLPLDIVRKVTAATMLIVAERHVDILEANRKALSSMRCVKQLDIIKENEALDTVAQLAAHWFERHLVWRARKSSTAS